MEQIGFQSILGLCLQVWDPAQRCETSTFFNEKVYIKPWFPQQVSVTLLVWHSSVPSSRYPTGSISEEALCCLILLTFVPLPCVSRLHCKTVSMLTVCDFIVETAQVVSFKFWNSTRCSKTFLYLTPCLAQCALHSLTLPLFASIGIEHHLEWWIAISSIGLVVGRIVMQKCLAETGGNKSKLTSRDYIKFEQSYLDPKVDASWSHFLHTGSLI